MKSTIPPGVGAALRERREELGLTLAEMAAATRIHKTYLAAIEEENYHLLPGGVYGIGFLRVYARDLGLPIESLLGLPGPAAEVRRRFKLPALGGRRLALRYAAIGLLVLLTVLAGAFGIAAWQRKHREVIAPLHQPDPPELQAGVPPSVPRVAPHQPAAADGQDQPPVTPVILQVLPAGGEIVRIVPVAPGLLKVVLDDQEAREYPLEPGQPLLWKVSKSLSCELSLPGLIRLWVGDTELTLGELPAFILVRSDRQPPPSS